TDLLQLNVNLIIIFLSIVIIFFTVLFLLPLFKKLQVGCLTGISITLVFASLEALLTWSQDIRNDASWLGHHYQPAQLITVTLQEDPIEKKKSYKALASARWIKHGDSLKQISGDIIIYFQKNDAIK